MDIASILKFAMNNSFQLHKEHYDIPLIHLMRQEMYSLKDNQKWALAADRRELEAEYST